jgi:restriction endonuclease
VTRVTEENVGAFIQGALDAPEATALGDKLEGALGAGSSAQERRVINALVALRLGLTPGTVARHLGWRDFERFCAMFFRARGYEVMENLTLRNPRVQIDLVAIGPSYTFCVDCKRWKKGHSPSVLQRFAAAQKRRSSLLRKVLIDRRPILSVILSLSAPSGDFVDGVAVVPIGSLTGFLESVEAYLDRLEAS